MSSSPPILADGTILDYICIIFWFLLSLAYIGYVCGAVRAPSFAIAVDATTHTHDMIPSSNTFLETGAGGTTGYPINTHRDDAAIPYFGSLPPYIPEKRSWTSRRHPTPAEVESALQFFDERRDLREKAKAAAAANPPKRLRFNDYIEEIPAPAAATPPPTPRESPRSMAETYHKALLKFSETLKGGNGSCFPGFVGELVSGGMVPYLQPTIVQYAPVYPVDIPNSFPAPMGAPQAPPPPPPQPEPAPLPVGGTTPNPSIPPAAPAPTLPTNIPFTPSARPGTFLKPPTSAPPPAPSKQPSGGAIPGPGIPIAFGAAAQANENPLDKLEKNESLFAAQTAAGTWIGDIIIDVRRPRQNGPDSSTGWSRSTGSGAFREKMKVHREHVDQIIEWASLPGGGGGWDKKKLPEMFLASQNLRGKEFEELVHDVFFGMNVETKHTLCVSKLYEALMRAKDHFQ